MASQQRSWWIRSHKRGTGTGQNAIAVELGSLAAAAAAAKVVVAGGMAAGPTAALGAAVGDVVARSLCRRSARGLQVWRHVHAHVHPPACLMRPRTTHCTAVMPQLLHATLVATCLEATPCDTFSATCPVPPAGLRLCNVVCTWLPAVSWCSSPSPHMTRLRFLQVCLRLKTGCALAVATPTGRAGCSATCATRPSPAQWTPTERDRLAASRPVPHLAFLLFNLWKAVPLDHQGAGCNTFVTQLEWILALVMSPRQQYRLC